MIVNSPHKLLTTSLSSELYLVHNGQYTQHVQ